MKRIFRFILGLCVGVAVGGAIGMIVTPKSGEDMQTQLKLEADALKEVWDEAFAARKAELEARLVDIQMGNANQN